MSMISGAAGQPSDTAQNQASGTSRLANNDMFMRLLVAQLKYQNPMNPADGIEFMTQLTQFSQLEQTVAIRQQLEDLAGMLAPLVGGDTGQS